MGEDITVECHTDLTSCCIGSQGVHHGDWYFPNGSVLSSYGAGGDIYKRPVVVGRGYI